MIAAWLSPARHVLDLIPAADNVNQNYLRFQKLKEIRSPMNGNFKKHLRGLELKYKYSTETTVQLKNNFLNCFDKIETDRLPRTSNIRPGG